MRRGRAKLSSMSGLTTTEAPFIEQARAAGELYITQPYDLYSLENHLTWKTLYARMLPHWERYANEQFIAGVRNLCFDPERVPRLEDINSFLSPLTGFKARAVSGYIPAFLFFDCLRRREFPTTITIRRGDKLDYLPEPDIFHDVAGHVPMHTDRAFAEALVRFGDCAHTARELVRGIGDKEEQFNTLLSIYKGLARFFWYTVEFGLMNTPHGLRAYGSGLLSSYGELSYALEDPRVQRFPIRLEWVINQYFEIHHYQPLLFIVESFDHLFELVSELEKLMKAGKLNNLSPGEPEMNAEDIESFLKN